MVSAVNSAVTSIFNLFRPQIGPVKGAVFNVDEAPEVAAQGQDAAKSAIVSSAGSYAPVKSDMFLELLKNQKGQVTQSPAPSQADGDVITLNTDRGSVGIDLNGYFSGDGVSGSLGGKTLPPLLLPSADNIQALAKDVSGQFKSLLTEYGISSAPAQITYDSEGQIQFPSGYAYSDDLKQALDENPAIAKELQTVNALTSHYVELQKSLPFIEEYSQAQSKPEAQAVIAKYKSLFEGGSHYSHIALTFSDSGDLGLTAHGNPIEFA